MLSLLISSNSCEAKQESAIGLLTYRAKIKFLGYMEMILTKNYLLLYYQNKQESSGIMKFHRKTPLYCGYSDACKQSCFSFFFGSLPSFAK